MKRLKIQAEKCTGCKICMATCSIIHYGFVSPLFSGIQIATHNHRYKQVYCVQCPKPPCVEACPEQNIIVKGEIVTVKGDCSLCGKCVEVCPYKAILIPPGAKKPVKCDLCMGKPKCVEMCPSGALTFS